MTTHQRQGIGCSCQWAMPQVPATQRAGEFRAHRSAALRSMVTVRPALPARPQEEESMSESTAPQDGAS